MTWALGACSGIKKCLLNCLPEDVEELLDVSLALDGHGQLLAADGRREARGDQLRDLLQPSHVRPGKLDRRHRVGPRHHVVEASLVLGLLHDLLRELHARVLALNLQKGTQG